MNKLIDKILGPKVGGVRVTPMVVKIVAIFTAFLLLSNFSTNAINLWWNRSELLKLAKELLIKDLKAVHSFADTQHQIWEFSQDLQDAKDGLEKRALRELNNQHACFLGFDRTGQVFFAAARGDHEKSFADAAALAKINADFEKGQEEGFLTFERGGKQYFGVYKWQNTWQIFLLRAEEVTEFYEPSQRILWQISIAIVLITLLAALVGVYLIGDLTRFVGQIITTTASGN